MMGLRLVFFPGLVPGLGLGTGVGFPGLVPVPGLGLGTGLGFVVDEHPLDDLLQHVTALVLQTYV